MQVSASSTALLASVLNLKAVHADTPVEKYPKSMIAPRMMIRGCQMAPDLMKYIPRIAMATGERV